MLRRHSAAICFNDGSAEATMLRRGRRFVRLETAGFLGVKVGLKKYPGRGGAQI